MAHILRPNSKGVVVPARNRILTSQDVHAWTHPTQALVRLDKILFQHEKPEIVISRRQGGIGDVLMTLPTVKAISKKYQTQVDYATDFDYLGGALVRVLQGNPYIRNIIPWRDVNLENYNAFVDLTCPCVAHEKPLASPINRIDLFARHAVIPLEDHSIDYFLTQEEINWAKDYLYHHNLSQYKIVLVQPSSSTTHRDCPPIKMAKAVMNLVSDIPSIRAIVITHDSDNIKTDWNFFHTHEANNLHVRQIAALMSQSEIVLCPDSAILHLASALHKKTVTLFGPTDPRARVNHHPEAVAIWGGAGIKSYPSWYDPDPAGGLCWKRIEETLISETVKSLLLNKKLPKSELLIYFGNYQQEDFQRV